MNTTLLTLEGKCLLSLSNNDGKISFYCNGFNVKNTVLSFSDLQEIEVKNLLLEKGAGNDYKSFSVTDFATITSYSLLKSIFNTLSNEVYIYDLSFSSSTINVSIHDNRDFLIHFNIETDLRELIIRLINKSLELSFEVSKNLFDSLNQNVNKLILISESGLIEKVFNTFYDYLVENKN